MSFRNKVLEGRILRFEGIKETLGGSDSFYFVLQTGSQPVILEGFEARSDLDNITMAVHTGEAFTGGTSGAPFNRNMHKQAVEPPTATEVVIITEPTITNAPLDVFDADLARTAFSGGIVSTYGVDIFVFEANTDYVVQVQNNTNANNQDVYVAFDLDDLSIKTGGF